MLSKLFEFVKAHIDTIILSVVIMLFLLFSFAAGYIMAKYQDRQPIYIQQDNKPNK